MENLRFTMPPKNSADDSANSTNQHQVAYASKRAEVLFGSYRRGDANDPAQYVAAITAILSLYEPDLIREVTDPRTGIQTSEKFMTFMPNAGELRRYCEAEAARRERMKQLAALPRPVPLSHRLARPKMTAPGCLANVFVPQEHARYARLCAWAETADPRLWRHGVSSDKRPGIWIGLEIWQGNVEASAKAALRRQIDKGFSPSTAADFEEEPSKDG